MRFLGGLLGGKRGAKSAVQDLLSELEGEGVSDAVWGQILSLDNAEDAIDEELLCEKLSALAVSHTAHLYDLTARCIEAAEGVLGKEGDMVSLDDAAENTLVTAILILTKILAAGADAPEEAGPTSTPSIAIDGGPLARRFWEAPTGPSTGPKEFFIGDEAADKRPLGERMVGVAMRVLFLDGFTVDLGDRKEGDEPEIVDGMDPAYLWCEGVGPDGGGPDKPDDDTRSNRQMGLQLLAALLCGAAPTAAAKAADEGDTDPKSTPKASAAALAEAALVSAEASAEVTSRRLVADERPLAYLCDPGRPVPFRAELLYSLLSVALGYDPHGYGVPYAGYFSGAKEETFATICLQVLGLLLQGGSGDASVPNGGVVERRPQEQPTGSPNFGSEAFQGEHFFRKQLAAITSEREVNYITNGIITLLGTVSEERSTYLPSSMRLPPFLTELLILVSHLAVCDSFVDGVCSQGDVPALVEGLLHAASQPPDHLREDVVAFLSCAALLRLTGYRDVCVALNEDFNGDVPDELPDFEGSGIDLVSLAVLKQASDYIATAKVNVLHKNIVQLALCTFANVSTFAEDLSAESCSRLFGLFERCVKSTQVKVTSASAWLPLLLESFENIVQYQYSSNTNLVYGLMTRQAMIRDMSALAHERATKGEASRKVLLDKAKEPKLGCEVDPSDGVGLRICRVDGGLMGLWNKNNPDNPLEKDDVIVEVNGVQGDSKIILQECLNSTGVLELVVKSTAEDSTDQSWWAGIEAKLSPILSLLQYVAPALEAEVEKKDISSPEEAKALLPRSMLGLLPVPHAFVMRSLRYNESLHRALEHSIVACLSSGPAAGLWDVDDESDREDESDKGADKKAEAKPRGREASPSRQRQPSAQRRQPSAGRRPSGAPGARDRSNSARVRPGSRGPPAGMNGNPSKGLPGEDPQQADSNHGVDVTKLAKELQAGQQAAAGYPDAT